MTFPVDRRWPSVLRAARTLFLFRLVAAFVLAYPVARTVGAFGATSSPEGDRILFRSGGFVLLETLRLGARAIGSALEAASAVGIIASLIGLVPLAVVLAKLSDPTLSAVAAFARARVRWPQLVVLWGLAVLAQGAITALSVAATTEIGESLDVLLDERNADLVSGFVALLGVVIIGVIGIAHDAARILIVRDGLLAPRAAFDGVKAFVTRPLRFGLGWLGPAAAGGAVVALAAWLVGFVDVSRPGAGRVLLVFGLHQAAAFTLAVLRVAWLETARRTLPAVAQPVDVTA